MKVTKVTGAGILLINKYNNKQGRYELAFLIVRNRATGLYDDPGGTHDVVTQSPQSFKKTALRELQEETFNLFKVSSSAISGKYLIEREYKSDRLYNSYILYIDSPIRTRYYNHNYNLLIDNKKVPAPFKETNKVNFIYISDFMNNINKDVNGNPIKLRDRTKQLFTHFINNYYNKISSIPKIKVTIKINKNSDYLTDTYSYFN